MRLQHLPHDVLCHIMRHAGQEARVTSMSVCRSLHAAANSPGVWTEVTLYDLDQSAVKFIDRHRCDVVRIVSRCPDDVAWFFEQLAERDVACMRCLHIGFGAVPRMPMDLMCGICAQRGLQHLSIRVASLDATSEIFFCKHHQLRELQTLKITEDTEDARQLVVWLDDTHARFRRLHTVELSVGMSDVLAGLRQMPSAQRVAYSFETDSAGGGGGETFEDMDLAGAVLDRLELDVDCEVDVVTMAEQLDKCRVGTLVLNVKDEYMDLTHGFGGDVDHLVLCMHMSHADVKLDFERVLDCRGLKRLSVRAAPTLTPDDVGSYTLYFERVASLAEWAAVTVQGGPLQLDLLPRTHVHLSPMP